MCLFVSTLVTGDTLGREDRDEVCPWHAGLQGGQQERKEADMLADWEGWRHLEKLRF